MSDVFPDWAQQAIGRPVTALMVVARARGTTIRVMRRDGKATVGTRDLVRTRLNVAIEMRHGVAILVGFEHWG